MWEYMWELRVDHAERILKSSDDKSRQQAHKARGVELCAVWVRGLGIGRISEGEEVAFEWDSSKQADPASTVWEWRRRLEAVCNTLPDNGAAIADATGEDAWRDCEDLDNGEDGEGGSGASGAVYGARERCANSNLALP